MSNNEITVRAKYTDEKLDEFLSESGFRELNKYYFTDVFLIPSEINIYNNNVRDILKKAILLREAKGITSNKNSKKITFKQKNINEDGEIISQSAIKCSIDSIEDAKKLFCAIGYREIMKIKEIHSTYEKDHFKLIIKKNIDNNYTLIEAEINEYYKTIDELKKKINEIKECVDLSDFFIKKAEIELQRIKDMGDQNEWIMGCL